MMDSDDFNAARETFMRSLDEAAVTCDNCGFRANVALRESLEPYTMTMCLTPQPGRVIDARVTGGVIRQLARMMNAISGDMGHQTTAAVMDVHVRDDMATEITMAFVPTRRAPDPDAPLQAPEA